MGDRVNLSARLMQHATVPVLSSHLFAVVDEAAMIVFACIALPVVSVVVACVCVCMCV